MSDLSTTIRQLVAADKLEQAIGTLQHSLGNQDMDLVNDLIAYQATLTRTTRDSRRGLVSGSEENQTRTRIGYALLEMLPSLEALKGKTPASPISAVPNSSSPVVFISYNHRDREIAHKLKNALEDHDIVVRIDSETMQAGEDIQAFIERSIRDTDVTILVVSNNSLLSTWVAMETINTFYHEKFRHLSRDGKSSEQFVWRNLAYR